MISVIVFMAVQQPEYRDNAQPKRPKSRRSWTLPGLRTGIWASMNEYSLWLGTVDDLQAGSSPASRRTPPFGPEPEMLP